MNYDLKLEFQLSAPPEKVLQLLTDAVLIRKWSGSEGSVDNKEGGAVTMFDGWATGRVLKTGTNELAYTWSTTDWAEGTPPTEVHYLLKKQDGGTLVSVSHTGFVTEEEMKSHRSGWTDYFFDPMEDYIMIFEQN
jgi:uncharacterized protein YndB with AHSA1/START domain